MNSTYLHDRLDRAFRSSPRSASVMIPMTAKREPGRWVRHPIAGKAVSRAGAGSLRRESAGPPLS